MSYTYPVAADRGRVSVAAKVAVAALTAVVALVLGACGLLFAMLALNGYNGAQGGRILGGYVVGGVAAAGASAVVGWLGFGALAGRLGWSGWAAAPVSFVAGLACACALLVAGFLLSLIVFG